MESIVIVNTYYRPHYGGVETTLYHIAGTMKKFGLQPIIITSNRGLVKGDLLPLFEEVDGVKIYRYSLPRRKSLVNLISIFEEYYRVIRIIKFVCKKHNVIGVFARSHVPGLAALSFKEKRIPVLYLPPSAVWIQSAPSMVGRGGSLIQKVFRFFSAGIQMYCHSFLQKQLISRAHKIWVFSDVMRMQMQSIKTRNQVMIVQPGVDLTRFKPVDKMRRQAIRHSIGLPSKDIIGLCLARLVPQKGIDNAVIAMSKLPADSRWKLCIVGDGPEELLLRRLVEKLNLSHRVYFFPPTSEPEIFYAVADVFLMVSKYEPFGQTLLEAQATGLPVVGFIRDDKNDIFNANSEVIINGETGWLIPYGFESLSQLLISIESQFSQSELVYKINARALMESNHRWDRFCEKLIIEFKALNA